MVNLPKAAQRVVLLVWLACLAGCTDASRGTGGKPGDVVETSRDSVLGELSDVVVDVTRPGDSVPSDGGPRDVAAPDVVACLPGARVCVRGALSVCDEQGRFGMPTPCPPGQICDGGACTDNFAYVLIVLDNAGMGSWLPPTRPRYTDPDLLDAVYSEALVLQPACSADYASRWPHSAFTGSGCVQDGTGMPLRSIDVARYWVRRLIERLGDNPRIRLGLFHNYQPEGEPILLPSHENTCERWPEQFCCGQDPACVALGYRMSWDRGESQTNFCLTFPGLKEFIEGLSHVAEGSPVWEGLPPLNDEPGALSLAELLPHMLAEPPEATAAELWQWVDQVEEIADTGAACGDDGGCAEGFCLHGRCVVHTNPEVVARPPCEIAYQKGDSNVVWPVLYYVLTHLVPQGRPCMADQDCLREAYKCTESGACADEARACRPIHIIVVSDFHYSDHGPDTQWLSLARLLFWGSRCLSDEDCAHGATCSPWPQATRHKGYGFCEAPNDTDRVGAGPFDDGRTFGPANYRSNIFPGALKDVSPREQPPPYAHDADGQKIVATTHAILVSQEALCPSPPYWSPFMAASVAQLGGGKAVIPCPLSPGPAACPQWGPQGDCDYERHFDQLVGAIEADAEGALCGPSSATSAATAGNTTASRPQSADSRGK